MQLHSHRIACILTDVVLATPGARLISAATAQKRQWRAVIASLVHVYDWGWRCKLLRFVVFGQGLQWDRGRKLSGNLFSMP